jgi:Xaa-Pro aminopeptidase
MPESDGRLRTRWETVWAEMDAARVGALIVYGLGALGQYGLIHYLTDRFPGPKGTYLVLPRGSPPTVVVSSEAEAQVWTEQTGEAIGIESPAGGSRSDTLGSVADLAGSSAGGLPVALAAGGGRGLPSDDLGLLSTYLGCGEIEDATGLVARAKRPKSAADVAGTRAAMEIAEAALDSFSQRARPGMTEWAAAAHIEAALAEEGAPISLLHVSAGPFLGQTPGNRLIREESLLTVFVEAASPAGYWVEVGALFTCGRVPSERMGMAEQCIEVLRQIEASLTPGTPCSVIAEKMADLVSRQGKPTIGFGHGVGIDEDEPLLAPTDPTVLDPNATLAVHPSLADGIGSVAVANTYHIDGEAAAPLSLAPYRVHALC